MSEAVTASPLDGVRVVDLTSYIAGSYAAMMLADLGADVIKVEALTGDNFRELPGFFGWNRGKRSIAVDLKSAEGRGVVERLAARADVCMENMIHAYEHREVGPLRLMGQSLVFHGTPAADPGPPPTLGEHTDEVLREAGYAEDDVAALRAGGIVRGPIP